MCDIAEIKEVAGWGNGYFLTMMARLIRQPKNLQLCSAGSIALGLGGGDGGPRVGRTGTGSSRQRPRKGSIRLGAVAGGVPGPNYYVDLFIDLVDDVFEHGYVLSQHVDSS